MLTKTVKINTGGHCRRESYETGHKNDNRTYDKSLKVTCKVFIFNSD